MVTMRTVQTSKLNLVWRIIITFALTIFALYFWLNAFIIGLTTLALIPAIFNALSIAPFQAITMFLFYVISVLIWIVVGWIFISIIIRIWRKQEIRLSRIIIGGAALILLVIWFIAQ